LGWLAAGGDFAGGAKRGGLTQFTSSSRRGRGEAGHNLLGHAMVANGPCESFRSNAKPIRKGGGVTRGSFGTKVESSGPKSRPTTLPPSVEGKIF
jgi:hypothetical protein